MTFSRLSLRALAITIAAVALACAAIALARPKPIESALLGPEWQCSRTAFIVTSCAQRTQQAATAVESLRKLVLRMQRD
jgi:hypothetical protein